jgi:AraC family transcriptional regulator of arabinose operon
MATPQRFAFGYPDATGNSRGSIIVTDKRISSAIEFLARADLATDIDIPRVAAAVNLSPSRFRHLFTKEVGASPRGYIRFLRMCRAKSLLENTFLQVKQVMLMVGYHDPSHFVRDFKRAFSTTPSAARRLVTVHEQTNRLQPPRPTNSHARLLNSIARLL